MSFDSALQRKILGRFATGVTVVTSGDSESCCAMTANAVMSLSLDPPLVLIAVGKRNRTAQQITECGCFAINVLGAEQEPVARRFATNGVKDLSGVACSRAETGAPVLTDALSWVECRLVETLPGGDHYVFIGEIVAGAAREGAPLLFYAGAYGRLASADSAAV
ncbi:MAG: flavin reductase family protein [Acidobacteria bacterium]|nr:flavin reductase family protein [Acidobacteriota bacterium]